MEAPLQRVAPGLWHRQPGRDIFGKARVIARGERPFGLAAIAPRHQTDRTLRGDMDEIGLGFLDMRGNGARARERQANFRIGWTGERAEADGARKTISKPSLPA